MKIFSNRKNKEQDPLKKRIENMQTDVALIKTLIEAVNKSDTLYVELKTVSGDTLIIKDVKHSPRRDNSMLGV